MKNKITRLQFLYNTYGPVWYSFANSFASCCELFFFTKHLFLLPAMAAASEQSQPRGGSSARSSKGPLDLGTEALPMARGEKARRVSYRGTLVKHWRADVEHQTSIFSFGSRMLNLGTSLYQ